MNNKNIILYYLENSYTRLKKSKTSGVGVFAIRDIPKGVDVFLGQSDQKWYQFRMDELKKFDKEIIKMIDDFFVIEEKGTVKIPARAFNGMDMSFYVNHSKKPNLKTTDDGNTFISLREIKKGEELKVDYGTYDYKYKK